MIPPAAALELLRRYEIAVDPHAVDDPVTWQQLAVALMRVVLNGPEIALTAQIAQYAVRVTAILPDGSARRGSGVSVLIEEGEGVTNAVLTARHVIEGAERILVEHHPASGVPAEAGAHPSRVLERGAGGRDAALISTPAVAPAMVEYATTPPPGAGVVSAGYAWGVESPAWGQLRAWQNPTDMTQATTAPWNPGDSGAGVHDERGRLLGIVVGGVAGGNVYTWYLPVAYAALQALALQGVR